MRAIILALAMIATPAGAAPDGADLDEVSKLSVAWMEALERKDGAALERMMAKEYTLGQLGGPQDSLVPRDRWLRNAAQRDFSDFEFRNMRVEKMGDRALVTADLRFRASPIPFRLDSTVMDEWIFRDGRWQVKARWLGNSDFSHRVRLLGAFVAGVIITLAAGWLRRRRRSAL